jgi:D-alanyl-D-alanine carboxypeptidase
MNTFRAAEKITASFGKLVSSDDRIHNAYLLVHSDRNGFHLNLAEGETETRSGERVPAHTNQPVFMASVGKLFTAVLTAVLVEQGRLSFEDPIAGILDAELMAGLHTFKGRDYSGQIQIKHLLNHTSGLHDYFEDKPSSGKRMFERILSEPERTYIPRDVVTWSKENLKAHFPPGKGFHYSDTGYHLLGLVVEAVTSMPFHAALSRYIFKPLEMNQAYLIGHSQPIEENPQPLAGVYNGQTNVAHYRSLSVDYAGGGVTAPLEDLLKFMQALVQGRIISAETFAKMDDCARFSVGIDYGYGMMKITTVPLLMPARFNCWGNAGSTGAFMFYNPGTQAYMIGSLNQFRYHAKAIRFMLRLIDTLIINSQNLHKK